MRRATHAHPAGSWPEAQAAGTVTLAFDDRFRRRVRLADDAGEPFLLDLARAQVLNDGDGLELEGGGWLRVKAAPERLAEVHCHGEGELARIAWHLGNRHLPVEFGPGVVRLRWDHVIVDMLHGLGAHVHEVMAPFTPESGAYSGGGGGHHHHGGGHEH
ncbi:urease accessory protein UreE [Azospirillum sp.]|uniref:urease accessory protein UreE n=1 Tax=Azospirillum sp. TaxID=34012 RepID=UPI002D6F4445|nr:urease accessory protein UreE [Azospirillum sp.]HYD67202.1 urease accessory protein UreE [Azospirillum sp.]